MPKTLKKIMYNSAILFFFYKTTLLKIKVARIKKSSDFLKGTGKFSLQFIQHAIKHIHYTNQGFNEKKLIYDIIVCKILYGFNAEEYLLFNLYEKKHKERLKWLSDTYMDSLNMDLLGSHWSTVYDDLRNKIKFYHLTKKYFNRDVLCVTSQCSRERLEEFVQRNTSFIAKPLRGTMGGNTHIAKTSDFSDINSLCTNYLNDEFPEWIFEELVEQVPELAAWNPSSVNTIRIPSFREKDSFIVLAPFIRTGRKGMVVDNGGQGGIFASIDVITGKVCTDGANEIGERFKSHPDSRIVYKNWQVPKWKELLQLSEEIHRSLPQYHKYVAFDFALTKNGWVLIEGNWGQFVCQQTSMGKGLRKEYEKIMSN